MTLNVGDTVEVITDRLAHLRIPLGNGAIADITEANHDDDLYTIDFANFPDADGSPDLRSYNTLHASDLRLKKGKS